MTSLSLRLPAEISERRSATAPATATAPARPGFWRRVYEAMAAAQMRKAEIEIRRYQHLFPADDENTPRYRVGLRDSHKLPFAG